MQRKWCRDTIEVKKNSKNESSFTKTFEEKSRGKLWIVQIQYDSIRSNSKKLLIFKRGGGGNEVGWCGRGKYKQMYSVFFK